MMVVLVTRPLAASLRTQARLQDRGVEAILAPLLDLEFMVPERLLEDELPDAVVMTSANGVHAISGHRDLPALTQLPLWTVGSRTSAAARALGFSEPVGEALDARSLVEMLSTQTRRKLLYIAAEVRSGDLGVLLPMHDVRTCVVYRASPVAFLTQETVEALQERRVHAVLHYSRRLAQTYVELARAQNVLSEALDAHQLCLSEQVAGPLREAGAARISIAHEPREDALLALIETGLLAKPDDAS